MSVMETRAYMPEHGLSPGQSFGLKLGVLTLTTGLVAWVGWPVEERGHPPIQPAVSPTAPPSAPPSVPDAPAPAIRARAPEPDGRPLDLNRATIAQLEGLPGVGPILAQRVVAYREARGGFRQVEDLLEVKGIGRKRLEQLRPLLKIRSGPLTIDTPRHRS